jgi:hypothetical protein
MSSPSHGPSARRHKQGKVWVGRLGVGIAISLCLGLTVAFKAPSLAEGKPSGGSEDGVRTVREARPWHLRRILGPRLIKLEMTAATCSGLQRPKVVKSQIVEYRSAVLITAIVRRETAKDCLDELQFVRTRVHLKKSLGNRKLKDASTTPPTRRWPK